MFSKRVYGLVYGHFVIIKLVCGTNIITFLSQLTDKPILDRLKAQWWCLSRRENG